MLLKKFSCSLILLLGMTTAAVADTPEEPPADLEFPMSPADLDYPSVVDERRECKYASECRWDWARKCEWWCQNVGGFDIMQSCSWGKARCCCNG